MGRAPVPPRRRPKRASRRRGTACGNRAVPSSQGQSLPNALRVADRVRELPSLRAPEVPMVEPPHHAVPIGLLEELVGVRVLDDCERTVPERWRPREVQVKARRLLAQGEPRPPLAVVPADEILRLPNVRLEFL